MSEAKPKGGIGRWLKRIGIVLVVLIGVVVILLATGIPQNRLVKKALSRALDSDVKVTGVTTLGKLRIAEIISPRLDVKGVDVEYALRAPDKRNLPNVHVESVTVREESARAGEPSKEGAAPSHHGGHHRGERRDTGIVEAPSYWGGVWHSFMKKLEPVTKKLTPDPERFVPKHVEVDTLDFARISPSASFGIEGPRIGVDIKRGNNYAVDIKADKAMAFCSAGAPDPAHKFSGTMNVHVEKGGGNIIVDPLNVSFPGLAEINGVVRVEKKEGKFDCNVNLEKAFFQDIDLSQADARDVRVPFAFKRLDLSGTRIQGKAGLDGLNVIAPEVAIKVAAEGLRVGPKDHEVYDGDLHLDISGKPGGVDLAMEATLNRGQKIHSTLSGPTTELKNAVQIAGWSKEDLLAALPKDIRGGLAGSPIEGITSANLDVVNKLLDLGFSASVKPALANGAAPLELTVKGQGSPLGPFGPNMITTAGVTLGDGTIKAERQTPVPPLLNNWLANVDNLALAQCVQILTGRDLPAGLDTRLKGTVKLATDNAFENVKSEWELSGSPLAIAPDGDVVLKGTLAIERKGALTMTSPSIELTLGKTGSVTLHDVAVAGKTVNLKGDIKSLNLDALTKAISGGASKAAGVANGTFTVASAKEGSPDFNLALTATEGFAIDQALLRQLLESPLAQQADHAQVEKALAELKDKQGLRPFDSAALNVSDKEGRVSGETTLKSKDMELTIPLPADMANLPEALSLLQSASS